MSRETELVHAVAVLHDRKQSEREIAAALGLTRGKVRRILARIRRERTHGKSALPAPRLSRASKLDPFVPMMEALVEEFPDITAVRLFEELQKQGFDGGYTIVKEWLREYRGKPKQKPVIRFETEPGEQGQQDWSPYLLDFTETGRSNVHCFSLILGYSRRHYIDFDESEAFFPLIRHHVAGFEYFGGVPAEILYDNQKAVVLRWEAQLADVLGLLEYYAADDLIAAFERAVRYKAFEARTIQRILERTAQPRALPDTLEAAAAQRLAEAARQAQVQPRPLQDYARALGARSPTRQEEE
jgi:transposase